MFPFCNVFITITNLISYYRILITFIFGKIFLLSKTYIYQKGYQYKSWGDESLPSKFRVLISRISKYNYVK